MNVLFKTFKEAGDLFIIDDYMSENVVTNNDDLFIAGAVIFDEDVYLGTPIAFAKMAIKANANAVMIDFSNLTEAIDSQTFDMMNEALDELFIKESHYYNSHSYSERLSYCMNYNKED